MRTAFCAKVLGLFQSKRYKKKRIIFIIPLLSVLDQNVKVIRDYLPKQAAILEHHSNVVQEKNNREETDPFEFLAESWNYPVVVSIGSMSILWTKKVERLCCFFELLILLLLRCLITNCTMDSFAVIPALYIFKDCPAGLFRILIRMKIDFFLFQYRMERFDTGIVIRISLSAK